LDIKGESAEAHTEDGLIREGFEKRILEVLSEMSIEDIKRLVEEMEAGSSS
jgi:hypothetical protein